LKNKLENSKMVAIGRGPPAGRILAMAGNNPAASRPSHGWSQPSHTPAHPGHARNSIRRTKRGARGDSNPRPHCLEAVELPLSYLSFCNLCLWYMLFILFMMPRQNNKKNDGATRVQTLAAGDVKHCLTIVLRYHWCLALAFFRIWIRSGRLDQSGCATSLI
jgi:hypothetical protein